MKSFADLLMPAFVNFLDRNPIKNSLRTIKAIRFLGLLKLQKDALPRIEERINNPEDPWVQFIEKVMQSLNTRARKKLIGNFMIKAGLIEKVKRSKLRAELQQNIPWAILLDPTSACNLKCLGCWANDYVKTDSMSYELLDRIIREGKEMGTYVFIYSGGEPLMRKKDIIRLCEAHSDAYFMAFTNGTLIDDHFAAEVARVGNFAPAISIEGFENETDFRRGEGTYKKAIRGMDLMRKYGNLYGFSAAYHRQNTEIMGSDEFLDFMMKEKACAFA